ncbi:HIT domain-containing protein [Brevibacterium sp. 5221]|uniref:HIT domain-containing protein n=1 Tax=Brevibacterium rongguiense TaxID=2695267 RepID=A0A6N9H519_9MICO|nr:MULTISPECIES: HIT family protein [Brevibacterium]MYM19009.1 HIT domain-containing protein [Brevibacterium rongguiense]WAL40702.1 HIT family protein [Brevibacterium sp. BRM-1]
MATIFTKIMDGEIPGAFVYEDEQCAAFLDVEPLTEGHVLVVPRTEYDHWVDMPQELTDHLMAVAQRIGRAQLAAFGAQRIGLMIQGYEVPHVHIHVWPTTSTADFDPRNKGPQAQPEALQVAAAKLTAELGDSGAAGDSGAVGGAEG